MRVIYYVTNHGFGHAVRTAAICNEFSPDVRLTLRSALPETFFREEIRRDFSYAPASFDCGCVQKDSLNVDIRKTLATYHSIAEKNACLLESEARWCCAQKADVIVSDIVPFAFDVAEQCSLPSVAVTNFTWFDIYREYADEFSEYREDVDYIRRQYAKATLLLSLEPALPMAYFRKKCTAPPTGRRGRSRRADINKKYGIKPDKHLGLMYFGPFGITGVDFSKLAAFPAWEFLGISPVDGAPPNYHCVPKTDFPYQDIVASADLMICKLGYGAVAEAMMFGTPLLYPPRPCFAEFQVLDAAVRSWGGGYPLSLPDFTSLDLGPMLERVVSKGRLKPCRTDGAEIAALTINKLSA
jgi:hypothetical protein